LLDSLSLSSILSSLLSYQFSLAFTHFTHISGC